MSDGTPMSVNQETHREYNRESGVAIIPGSNLQREMAKFEQFHSKWTDENGPGNPYVKREFPKMLYRAQRWDGTPACMAAPPDPFNFRDPREADRAALVAEKFTRECQSIVNDEREMQKAMESGWRESPAEAVEYLKKRDLWKSTAAAHREYEDRNMSEMAKREISEAKAGMGGEPLAEIKESRRGRPRKSEA